MSNYLSLEHVAKEINRLFKLLPANRPIGYYLAFGNPVGDEISTIVIDSHGYNYVFSERGRETRDTTEDISELLYWVFKDIIISISHEYVAMPGYSLKRTWYKFQLELLRKINPEFAEKRKIEMNNSIEKFPFDDELPNDLDYSLYGSESFFPTVPQSQNSQPLTISHVTEYTAIATPYGYFVDEDTAKDT